MLLKQLGQGRDRRSATLGRHSGELWLLGGLLGREGEGVNTSDHVSSAKKVLVEGKFRFRSDPGRVNHEDNRDTLWVEVIWSVAPLVVFVDGGEVFHDTHAEVGKLTGVFEFAVDGLTFSALAAGADVERRYESDDRAIAHRDFGDGADDVVFELGLGFRV